MNIWLIYHFERIVLDNSRVHKTKLYLYKSLVTLEAFLLLDFLYIHGLKEFLFLSINAHSMVFAIYAWCPKTAKYNMFVIFDTCTLYWFPATTKQYTTQYSNHSKYTPTCSPHCEKICVITVMIQRCVYCLSKLENISYPTRHRNSLHAPYCKHVVHMTQWLP